MPDSIRPIDPTMDPMMMINTFDPLTGQAIQVMNMPRNYGWEYVWHCHMLSHEEMDFMRPVIFHVSPAAPTGLTVTGGQSTITVKWTNNATAVNPKLTNFTLQRASDAGFTQNVVNLNAPATSATSASYTDTTMTLGTLYYYRVRAESAQGYSVWSNSMAAATVLPAPAGLTATVSANTPLAGNLTWTNGAAGATGTTVQRATNLAFTAGLTTVNLTGAPTAYSDTTAKVGTTYYYRVRSSLAGAVSGWSNVATVKVTVPATPVITRITIGRTTATISWSQSSTPVGGFTVQVSPNQGFTGNQTSSFALAATQFSYTAAGLSPNTRYYFRVRTSNGAGLSAWSATAVGKTLR